MFKQGESVLYGANGVYIIEDIRVEEFLGEKREYYVLSQPDKKTNNKLFIPCDNEQLTSQIKPLLSREEIYELIKKVPKEPMDWINESRARNEHFKAIFSRADRVELMHLVKTIYLRKQEMQSQGKKVFLSDEHTLERAEKLLFDEITLVIDIEREDIIPLIFEQLIK